MNAKKITMLVSLEHLGEFKDVPKLEDCKTPEQHDARTAAISHNMQVRMYRALCAEPIAECAQSLGFLVHVGAHGMLLRGKDERADAIEWPDYIEDKHVREASERWMPKH